MATNIMVNAGAGSGKTFCVTEGLHHWIGAKRKTVPSPEQQVIWNAMAEDDTPGRIHMTSFTVDASDQLAAKGPLDASGKPIASSKSTYGTGLSYAKAKGQAGYVDIYGNKYKGLTTEFLGGTKFETGKTDPGLWDAIHEIQSKARLDLKITVTEKEAEDLANWYGIDMPEGQKAGVSYRSMVTEGVNAVLAAGREKVGSYDFVDQVYLPVVQDLVKKRYDTIIVDEAQDMGRAQQEVCLRCSYRRIIIGDPHQAIFGFAGADSDAFGRLGRWLDMTLAGCQRFPLNMTRRCAKAIVRRANRLVDTLTAMPDAPEGQVHSNVSKGQFFSSCLDRIISQYGTKNRSTSSRPTLWANSMSLGPQDLMIICPTNAPLISVMFSMQEKGIKSFINGSDITISMVKFVNKFVGMSELRYAIQDKLAQIESRRSSTNKQTQLDLYEALQGIADKCHTVDMVVKSINNMFSDVRRPGWIELSSIHKAKGREADTIVIWNIDRCKSPYSKQPWEHQQDRNLEYVAITRAKSTLYEIRSR